MKTMQNKANKINYQLKLNKILEKECVSHVPSLLLHACCAPCSSYVIEYLSDYFDITLYFYNPNINNLNEYNKRADELERLIAEMPLKRSINLIVEEYDTAPFLQVASGLESSPEKGERCEKCFYLRLEKTADYAKKHKFDYFCTTLSISPHKNAQLLNEIGLKLANIYDISYLLSDFKKNEGFKRSIQLSNEYNLYRQNYCGCIFSKKAYEKSTLNIDK